VNIVDTVLADDVWLANLTSKYATGSDVRRSLPASIGEKKRIETSVWNGSYDMTPNGYSAA
jgi:hypothetical protein